ncbi:putative mitochondrial protein [Cucumis melo var. makuwa]|uniref:Putative mitochondrial protein n=1 Tax=Cucumis melo var. makuwa TaxID=1194695 RepID=A0A5D3C267_CUCMM|nr:putative mitochondrial protein [Cucumis melo var. makuwa]
MQLYHDALLLPRCSGTMVYFTERFLSGVRHLIILSDRNQPREDGLSLIVEKSWAGAFADHWPHLDNNSVLPRLSVEIPLSEGKSAWVLQSSIHNEAPNSGRALTLGQRLIEGQTRWGTMTKVPGEFCFTDCYWEWLELVVGRNTRLLYSTRLYGVVTASLYTYDRNSDVGDFYEERIPSFKELTSTSRDTTKCLPTTCQYLFQAYYSIVCTQRNDRSASSKNDSQVTIGSWISFWYLGSKSYDKPITRKQKKALRSKFTQNSDGSKIQARSFLRPGVFTVASLMATGTIYSIAIPVLANIYHGLGLITKAFNPIGRMDFHFPMHYVHGWLAYYFDTHYPLPTEVRGPKMTNFSGEGGMPPAITLDDILYHWRICTRHNTLSELYLPARSLEPCKHVTQQFTDWWTTRHKTYFEDNRHHLVSSVIPPPSQPRLSKNRGSNLGGKEIRLVEAMAPNLKEEVKKHKDESDSSKSYRHWKRPLKKAKVSGDHPDGRGLSALEVPDVPPLSPLNDHLEGLVEPVSDESLTGLHAVDSVFEEVGTSKTPVNKLAEQSLRPSALLEEIRRGKMIVGEKTLRALHPKKLLSTDKARQLNEKTSAIKEALTLVKQLRGDAKVIQERTAELSLERKELEKRLRSINAKSEKLSILSCEKAEVIDQQELKVAKL